MPREPAFDAGDGPPISVETAPIGLLDGVAAGASLSSSELADVAGDVTASLERRLEAYEDLIDSEVGDTAMSRGRHLERDVGLRQLYLKFEGGNPTGTQKDRIAFAQAMDALRRGFAGVTVASCGNYGAAMAVAARLAGLRCVVYIPAAYRSRRIADIEQQGAEIRWTPGSYEEAVAVSQAAAAADDDLYDANPGGANTAIQLQAYGQIAYEIYDELRDAPAAVAVPASNGTTLAGIYRGFVSLHRRGKTSRLPRMIAGSASGKNPIVRAAQRGLERCEDLPAPSIHETAVNEPLINWHAIDGDLALAAIRTTGGWAGDVSDRKMLRLASRLRQEEGLSVLPASTAGLHALLDGHLRSPLPSDRYVAILTGRRR